MELKKYAANVLETLSPNESMPPVHPKIPKTIIKKEKLDRQKSLRFSFTRSVSREIYEQQLNNSNLTDGCTPICVLDNSEIHAALENASKLNAINRKNEVDIDALHDDVSN